MNILVIEDDAAIRDMICLSLTQAKFETRGCADVKSAKQLVRDMKPDCLVVDWMLPDSSGIELIRWLRRQPGLKNTPALMLTARAEERDKIMGLDSGADDYMTKPLSLRELQSRIRALLRRPAAYDETPHQLEAGMICMNVDRQQVMVGQKQLDLSKTEYRLLRFFLSHQNKVYTRDQILSAVWGADAYLGDRTVDVHILRLRKLLKPFKLDKTIKTVRGSGYRFSITS